MLSNKEMFAMLEEDIKVQEQHTDNQIQIVKVTICPGITYKCESWISKMAEERKKGIFVGENG